VPKLYEMSAAVDESCQSHDTFWFIVCVFTNPLWQVSEDNGVCEWNKIYKIRGTSVKILAWGVEKKAGQVPTIKCTRFPGVFDLEWATPLLSMP
jgi:hypothetical protein